MSANSASSPTRLPPARDVRHRMRLHLNSELARFFSRGSDDERFDCIIALEGETFREHKHRRTVKVDLDGRNWFLKVHGHTTWAEILKNALRLRWPTLDARPEVQAINRLTELGIPTMEIGGWGVRGRWPHRVESFLFTRSLEGFRHLDEVVREARQWSEVHKRRFHRAMIDEIAIVSRAMHTNGVNHRDYYLCHFMLPDRDWAQWQPSDPLRLHVIDLHRAQVRRRAPWPAVAKDLSGLLFSALDADLSLTDLWRFLRLYWGANWKQRVRQSRLFLRYVRWRALKLYQSEHGRPAELPD